MKKATVFFKRYFTLERGEYEEFYTKRPDGDPAYIGEKEITADDGAEFEIYQNFMDEDIISNGEMAVDLHLFLSKRAYLDGVHYRTVKDVEKICQY
jgi:hypothetical protein